MKTEDLSAVTWSLCHSPGLSGRAGHGCPKPEEIVWKVSPDDMAQASILSRGMEVTKRF
jgi:hypothetical protein